MSVRISNIVEVMCHSTLPGRLCKTIFCIEAPEPVRRIEVWVDDAHWWLTHDDGQLQLADVCFTNFSYNRISFSDDSGEHRLELGTFKVSNLMPNTPSVYQVLKNKLQCSVYYV